MRFLAWLVAGLTLLIPPLGCCAEFIASGSDELEAYWTELTDASEDILRKQAKDQRIAANGIECRIGFDGEGRERYELLKARTRFLVSEIKIPELPPASFVEYRGYLYVAGEQIMGATMRVSGEAYLEIDGEPLMALSGDSGTASRCEYLDLAPGYHPIRVRSVCRIPRGSLEVVFIPDGEQRVTFRPDFAASPPAQTGQYQPWDPVHNRLSSSERLAALARWLAGIALSPGQEDALAREICENRQGFPPEARPYLLFLEGMGQDLRQLREVRRPDPEPVTGDDLIVRASGERAFLFIASDRPARLPTVPPWLLVQLELPSGPKLVFPKASQFRLTGNRPRILPVGLDLGELRLTYSTAQPLAVFEDREHSYLVGMGERGERVEYAFRSEDVRSVDAGAMMGDLSVRYHDRTIVVPVDAWGHFRVHSHRGKALIVKTIDFLSAENASIWKHGQDEVLVRTDLKVLGEFEHGVLVGMSSKGYQRIRIFPGWRVEAIESDGERFEARRQGDWAEIRFAPSVAQMVAKIASGTEVELLSRAVGESVKDIDLLIGYDGTAARAYVGDALLAETESPEGGWRFSVLEVLRGEERRIRFEFDPPGGKLLSAKVEAKIERRLRVIFAPPGRN
jgi:hypothetical protein